MKLLKVPVFVASLFGFGLLSGLGTSAVQADYVVGTPENLGPTVNSSAADWGPSVSSDGTELYFESNRSGGSGTWDLWVSTRVTAEDDWAEPTNLGSAVNSDSEDSNPAISSDGLELYFTSNRSGGSGGHDIWVSRRTATDESWGTPQNLGSIVNCSGNDSYPCISSDGLELYFNCSRDWGLYVTRRAALDRPWGTPVMVPGYMIWPHISADGLVLLFGNDEPGGYGSNDIWLRTRATTGHDWEAAVNLGPTINGSAWECEPCLSHDGRTLYFTSNRAGGIGGWDTWQASITPVVDLNGDGLVNIADMCIMGNNWGTDEPLCDIGPMPWGDGIVDFRDFTALVEYWLLATTIPPLPSQAELPSPVDLAIEIDVNADLSWTRGSDALSHDIYFGTTNPPPFVCNQTETTFEPGTLETCLTYYWRIDEINVYGTTEGTVWSFTTVRPEKASRPIPADGAVNVLTNTSLNWAEGFDAKINYIYIGTDFASVNAMEQCTAAATHPPYEPLTDFDEGKTVYWRVDTVTAYHWDAGLGQLVIDSKVKGDVWSFTTIP